MSWKVDGAGFIYVPCGKCSACVARDASQWTFRILRELDVSDSAVFATLTYNDKYLPFLGSLSKRDLTLFHKKLRHRSPKLKYFAVGEYGSHTFRPHYHGIYLNSFPEDIEKVWENGVCHFGDVNGNSIGYTVGYINKKVDNRPFADLQESPFRVMSKGIGLNYVDKLKDWHNADPLNRVYCNDFDTKVSMPRYYRKKIFSDEVNKSIFEKSSDVSFGSFDKDRPARIFVDGEKKKSIVHKRKI